MSFDPLKPLKNLIHSIGDLLEKIFGDKSKDAESVAEAAINIVDDIRSAASSETVTEIAHLLPGTTDDKIISAIEADADKILEYLTDGKECYDKPTVAEKIACAIQKVEGLEVKTKSTVLNGLAALIGDILVPVLADGKLTIQDLFIAVPLVFRKLFGK